MITTLYSLLAIKRPQAFKWSPKLTFSKYKLFYVKIEKMHRKRIKHQWNELLVNKCLIM